MTSRNIETVPLPALPVDFPELRSLPLDKLEQLELNPLSLDDFIANMTIIHNYTKAKEETNAKKIEICRNSLAVHSKIEFLRESVLQSSDHLRAAREKAEQSNAERNILLSKHTPKNLMQDLTKVAESSEAAADKIASSFTSVEAAKADFLTQRVLYHKAMALSDLISAHGTRSNILSQSPTRTL